MFPSSCLDAGITRVGPGQYPQDTRAHLGGLAVGPNNTLQGTMNSRKVCQNPLKLLSAALRPPSSQSRSSKRGT